MYKLLTSEAVISLLRASNKKQALRKLSEAASRLIDKEIEALDIFDALVAREKLGGTGMERGVAIPHAKIKGLETPTGLFARLEKPLDFEAHDEMRCDLIFVLLVPEDDGQEHLKCLSRVARILHSTEICDAIRGAADADAIFQLLTESLREAA